MFDPRAWVCRVDREAAGLLRLAVTNQRFTSTAALPSQALCQPRRHALFLATGKNELTRKVLVSPERARLAACCLSGRAVGASGARSVPAAGVCKPPVSSVPDERAGTAAGAALEKGQLTMESITDFDAIFAKLSPSSR